MEALRHRVIDSGPEWEEVRTVFDRAEAERKVWIRMWPELREKYPRQFVARVGASIVAVHADLTEMMDALAALGLRSPDEVSVEYIYDGTEKFIL